jgi:hypothetical protein
VHNSGANLGRFWSADPAGLKAVRPKNPKSWNRYAYANDDPVNGFDPSGNWTEGDENYDSTSDTGCVGGYWVDEYGDWGGQGTGTCGGQTDTWPPSSSPTGSDGDSCASTQSSFVSIIGVAACPVATQPPPPQPTCFIELKFRSVTAPGFQEYNHAYLWVQDERGTQWVLEGQPQHQNPLNWGNLLGYATQGTGGAPGYPQDAINDREQGQPISGGQNICNLVDKAISLTQNYLQNMFGGNPVPYSPRYLNSNYFAHLLVTDLGIDIFGTPPSAPGW